MCALAKAHTPLVILPGIADAVQPVTASPRAHAWFYHSFGQAFRVYLIGRKRGLLPGSSTRDIAADYAHLPDTEIGPSHVLGLSMRVQDECPAHGIGLSSAFYALAEGSDGFL